MANTALAQFYVVVRTGQTLDLQRVQTTAVLQKQLVADFQTQMNEFLDNKTEVDFAPSYQPDKEEIFCIKKYAGPTFLQQAVTSPQSFPALALPFTKTAPWVEAILVASPADAGGTPVYLFQYFDRRRILNIEKTLIWRKGIFGRLEDPGVVIGNHLDAVIMNGKLLFHSFHLTSQFLPLHDYFEAATDDDVRELVAHRLFVDGNADDVIATANDVTRKRISMVLKAGTLSASGISAEGIQAGAKKFDIELKLKGRAGKRRIVFPEESGVVRVLLQFLAEGFYIGPISGEPYVANSYRKLR